MIKVFLVEDEAIIRRGIKKNVEWEKNGFEFVGEAGDGEYAYPQILKTEPDILITDIKMPFMDGLELSHLVKKIRKSSFSADTMSLSTPKRLSPSESANICSNRLPPPA